MAPTTRWQIRRGQTVYGPFTGDRLQSYAQAGRLRVGDEIRSQDDDPWIPVARVRQLRPYLKPAVETWFVQVEDAISGPFTSEELRRLAEDGALTTVDLVRRGDDGSWVSATRLQGVPLSDTRRDRRLVPSQAKTVVAAERSNRPEAVAAGADSSGQSASRGDADDAEAGDRVGAWRGMQHRLLLLAVLTIGPFLLPNFGASPSSVGVGLLAAATTAMGWVALRWTFAADGRSPSWSGCAFLFSAVFGATTLLVFVDVALERHDDQIGWQNVPMWLTKQIGVAYHHATESDVPVDTVTDFLRRLAALIVSVGFFEELLKLLPLAVALSIQPTLALRSCMYVGAISGLGFGLAEGLWRTQGEAFVDGRAFSQYFARFCGGSMAHAILSALAAYCAWQLVRQIQRRSQGRYVGAAATTAVLLAAWAISVPHALYDACLMTGLGGLAGMTLACCVWAAVYFHAFGAEQTAPKS